MILEPVGEIPLPAHQGPGGFDHAAVHRSRRQLYVAHTANNTLDVIDCEAGPIRLGLAATLANALGAVCLRPEELSADGLAGVVRSHREAA